MCLMFQLTVTRFHSPRQSRRPRNRNWRHIHAFPGVVDGPSQFRVPAEGPRFYTRSKTVTQRRPVPRAPRAEFVIPTMR